MWVTVVGIILVVFVVYGIRLMNGGARQGPLSRPPSLGGRRQGGQRESIERGLAARRELAEAFTPEAIAASRSVPRPFGVTFAERTAEGSSGLPVLSVEPSSPAARVGVVAGAEMISINGIALHNAAAASDIIDKQMPGQGVQLVWRLNGQHRSASVLL
jgi:S1-C subfamily serine protease